MDLEADSLATNTWTLAPNVTDGARFAGSSTNAGSLLSTNDRQQVWVTPGMTTGIYTIEVCADDYSGCCTTGLLTVVDIKWREEGSTDIITCLNDDDDNGTNGPDLAESSIVTNENNLREFAFDFDTNLVSEGVITVSAVDNSRVEFWLDAEKAAPVPAGGWDLANTTPPTSVWVEAVAVSSANNDTEIEVKYAVDNIECSSIVPLTIIDVEEIMINSTSQYDSAPIPLGGYLDLVSDIVPALSPPRALTWSIVTNDCGVNVSLISSSGPNARVHVDAGSSNGWFTLRAADSSVDDCDREVEIYVGCASCPQGSCTRAAQGFFELGSLVARFGLGQSTVDGTDAGSLALKATTMSPQLVNPNLLKLNSLDPDVELLRDANHQLRQIRAHQVLADIQVVHDYRYDIVYYYDADVLALNGEGLYNIDGEAEPVASFRIENPDGAAAHNRLTITEDRGGILTEYAYVFDAGTGWSLSRGNGLQNVTESETTNGLDRVITRTIADSNGVVVARTETTVHTFPRGEEATQRIVDPNGAALTTTFVYYEDAGSSGSYGQIKSQTNPDGSWRRWTYDASGRISKIYSPWLDSPIDAPDGEVRITEHDYTAVDSNDPGPDTIAFHSPRTVVQKIENIIVSRRWHAYYTNGSHERVEITERDADQDDGDYGNSANLRTVRTNYPAASMDEASRGKVKTIVSPDGRMQSYVYAWGQFDDVSRTFTPGSGDDLQSIVVQGTISSPLGVASKTTRDVTYTDGTGNPVYNETWVYTG
ncbi:MAG: hypothetical protein AAF492_09650, partial [Verrucomicrobiota bacterium]